VHEPSKSRSELIVGVEAIEASTGYAASYWLRWLGGDQPRIRRSKSSPGTGHDDRLIVEADRRRLPSVHQMMLSLEKAGLISRQQGSRGVSRSCSNVLPCPN
jgi:hypothetical protein